MAADFTKGMMAHQRKRTFLLLVAAVACLVSACVLPNRLAEDEPFSEQVIGFIDRGITPRKDVENILGVPYRTYSDNRWWLYQSNRRMTEWFWFIGTPGGVGGDTFGGENVLYSLIIEFGEQDTVQDLEIVTSRHPCTDSQLLCYQDGVLSVMPEGATTARAFHDDSANALLSDRELQAQRIEAEAASHLLFIDIENQSITSDSGGELKLKVHDETVFEVGETDPFTGQIVVHNLGDAQDIKLLRTYVGGRLHGPDVGWYANEELAYYANYKNNRLHGPMIIGYRDGTTGARICYENGEVVSLEAESCPH